MSVMDFTKEFDELLISEQNSKEITELAYKYRMLKPLTHEKTSIASAIYVVMIMDKNKRTLKQISSCFKISPKSISSLYPKLVKIYGKCINLEGLK